MEQALAATGAIAATARRFESLVTAKQVMCHWVSLGTVPTGLRFTRAVEPVVAEGRVLAVRDNGIVYYGVADSPFNRLPAFQARSNLARVEEALRVAVERAGAPVPFWRVEDVLSDVADLRLDPDAQAPTFFLQTLVRTSRAVEVRPDWVGPRRRLYTVPGAATTARLDDAEYLAQRRRAIRSLWNASHGRPFTTHALRMFATSTARHRIANDPAYGWANALQHLESIGEIIGIRDPRWRWVRWAPATEWTALTPEAQAARLFDDHRVIPSADAPVDMYRGDSADALGLLANAAAHDVAHVSRNNDMRAVLAITRAHLVAGDPDPLIRATLERRPLSRDQIIDAAGHFAHLVERSELTTRLSEASRRRPGIIETAITNIGRVDGSPYYALEGCAADIALVETLGCLKSLRRLMRAEPVTRLLDAERWATQGQSMVHPAVLALRGRFLADRLQYDAARLEAGARDAALFLSERTQAREVVDWARGAAEDALAVEHRAGLTAAGTYAFIVAPVDLSGDEIHVDSAASIIKGIARYRMANGQELSARIPSVGIGADVLRRITSPRRVGRGRRRQLAVDRIGFAQYVTLRWGGPLWSTVAATAADALGELRDATPLIELLAAPTASAYHSTLLASLVFFDDTAARQALIHYIEQSLVASRQDGATVPSRDLVLAACGLARKHAGGIAPALEPSARAVLRALVDARATDAAGLCAQGALNSWSSADDARAFFLR